MTNAKYMNTIKCPHCGKPIELTEALSHQVREQIVDEEQKKFANEITELKKKLDAAEKAELEIRKQKNDLDEEKRRFELEKQRQLDRERESIGKKAAEEQIEKDKYKLAELEKKLSDTSKALEDANRKATQGSQQLQGEVAELDLEETLRRAFPSDVIEPVGKGVLGADIRQVVKSPGGKDCGTILWESKRTKAWSDAWIGKLKDDMRADRAHIPALVSDVLPDEAKTGMGMKDGVWVCLPKLFIPMATLLRLRLIDAAKQKFISENRLTKAEQIYSYVTSHEFAQQVESMVEVYNDMLAQITKERTAFERSWKLRETQVQRLLSGVSGIYGSIQGAAGPALPPIKSLELDSA
jgi:hypothetical protein